VIGTSALNLATPLSIQEIDLFAPCEVGETQQIGAQLKIVGPLNDSTKRPAIEAARIFQKQGVHRSEQGHYG
jgi:hypothetical protein